MKLFKLLIITTLSICSSFNGIAQHLDKESLEIIKNKSFEIIALELNADTLHVVSTNPILYYPFGVYSKFEDFYNKYLLYDNKYLKIDSLHKDFTMIKIQSKNSVMVFVENIDTEKLEILSANVNKGDFEFVEGRSIIGLKKADLLSILFSFVPEELKKITVIEISSGLEGIWYYYNFSEDNLKNVLIKTDYVSQW